MNDVCVRLVCYYYVRVRVCARIIMPQTAHLGSSKPTEPQTEPRRRRIAAPRLASHRIGLLGRIEFPSATTGLRRQRRRSNGLKV